MFRKLIAGAEFSAQVLRQLVTDLNQNFGAIEPRFIAISASTTAVLAGLDVTYLVTTTAGDVTLTLPPASLHAGRRITVKKLVAANTLTIDPNGAETVDGAATLTLTAQWATRTLYCNGTSWFVVAN
jgi:hypothetical protein